MSTVSMIGMSAESGDKMSGLAHLKQSIRDILTTPVGTRVMRREYGSKLFELVDAPLTGTTLIDLYAATAEALSTWEPRFRLSRVQAEGVTPGHVTLTVEGEYLPDGREVRMEGILI